MTERTFVGIAINVDGSVFLNRYKIKIEEIMKICNINEIDIIIIDTLKELFKKKGKLLLFALFFLSTLFI